jgi:hypothetical protein
VEFLNTRRQLTLQRSYWKKSELLNGIQCKLYLIAGFSVNGKYFPLLPEFSARAPFGVTKVHGK